MNEREILIGDAKKVIASHESYAREGDLEGLLTNIAEDIVLLAADAPLAIGKEAFRTFYSALFDMGEWDFQHHYSGADVVADAVLLYGVAKGTHTSTGGEAVPLANNFLLILKMVDRRFKVWRGAFAPSGAP